MNRLFDQSSKDSPASSLYQFEESESSYKFYNFDSKLKYAGRKYIFTLLVLMFASEIVAFVTHSNLAFTVWYVLFAFFIIALCILFYLQFTINRLNKVSTSVF